MVGAMDNHTEPLAEDVWRIEVGPMTNAYLLADDDRRLTLVDTGFRSSGPRLVRSVRLLGFDPRAIDHVVLTHWHADHTGAVARFAASSAAPTVSAGRDEVPAITGAVRHPQAESPDTSPLGRFIGRWTAPGAPVERCAPLDDGDVVPGAGGAVVLTTPGHTPGHICLHVRDRGILLAGDAVMNVGWLSRGVLPFRSARSHEHDTLHRLSELDFDVLAVGHGPPVRGAQRRLRRLADRAARRRVAT